MSKKTELKEVFTPYITRMVKEFIEKMAEYGTFG